MSRKPFESPAGLSAGAFARLEVCLLAAMHRLSDDQVLELADTLHSVIRARRHHRVSGPRFAPPKWTPRTPDGKVVDLWPGP